MIKFRMRPLLVASLALCVLAAGAEWQSDSEFLQWSSAHLNSGRVDLAAVYPVWRRNAEFVRQQNNAGLSYTLSLNKFAHLTSDDLLKTNPKKYPTELPPHSDNADLGIVSIPSSVDWRTKGVVPPVRNQGQCGDAGVFALVGAIDSFNAIETGKLVMASEEEFENCCDKSDPCGCEGGFMGLESYVCVHDIGGLAGEEEYKSPNCSCLNNTYKAVVQINGGTAVQSENETALAVAVAMQPVAAAIDASQLSFQFYREGIYDDPSCSSTQLDHAVLVVGYGTLDGKDYWIAQNSWGIDWGMKGYILMSRNKNNQCGIATFATYPF